MRSTLISAILTSALVSANPHLGMPGWEPAGPDDFRGPCPMLNTLANHNFLPHDGKGITEEVAVQALTAGLNFNATLAALMFKMAVVANPEPKATFFTLDHLNQHNVLEHDASLSRSDAFFGNNHVFNKTIFDETRAYWTGPVLDVNMLANGKIARQINSKAYNPEYTFTESMENFSLGEVAAPIIVFGDLQTRTVDRALIDYFFENERLPTELGWTKPANALTQDDVLAVSQAISEAANLITPSEPGHAGKRGDLHSGLGV
ncbi:hypothetical protein AJ79_07606 [Helicocarpus griseus UAMH5409]|uniref:Heme haloperoxidase family profile domain-containing protein n=1 Tax=Helicocarpus griseus UAMH5409 TaxID=1447875 RepID=A0A2B7X1I8_9EURO|nr:hypothetical protein AJ79_07606 [Helicocarpus griseus UAMH5409]